MTLSKQEIFDTVVRHLYTQGCRAIDEKSGSCMYRGANNTKCAVGCLIPDELYDPVIEGGFDTFAPSYDPGYDDGDRSTRAVARGKVWAYLNGDENVKLLNMLQDIHDTRNNWGPDGLNAVGRGHLLDVAHHFGLETAVLGEFKRKVSP